MLSLHEATELLERIDDLPHVYSAIAATSFNDICDVDELPARTNGAVVSKFAARRLYSERHENGLVEAGAVIDKPGMRSKFVVSKFYVWLTSGADSWGGK